MAAIYQQGSTAGTYPWTPVSMPLIDMSIFNVPADQQAAAGQRMQAQLLNNLMGEYQRAYNSARQTNEQRYQDILGGYRDRYGEAMGLLSGLGDQARRDVRSTWQTAETKGMQDLYARGMTNATLVPSMRMGYQREMTDAMGRLEEQLRREQLGWQTQLSGDTLGFMERRQDEYPSLESMANLAVAMGRQGYTPQTNNLSYQRPQNATYQGVAGYNPAQVSSVVVGSPSPAMLPWGIQRSWANPYGGIQRGAGGIVGNRTYY